MEQLTFSTLIRAPRALVWYTMLDPQSYREWTKPFMEGSYYEGSWDEGATIRFLSPSGEGMVARIARNQPQTFLSIEHQGFVSQGQDDTQSEAVKSWAPAYENYRFETEGDATRVTVTQDVLPDFAPMMSQTWPKALEALRLLCENSSAAPAPGSR